MRLRRPLIALILVSLTLQAQASQLNQRKPLPRPWPAEGSGAVETESVPATERLPGEDMDHALPISSLPFYDTGNTCGYADDYAVMCPYGNWAPDIVYAFTPEEATNIRISLCESYYDTALFLFHTDGNHSHLMACNDDLCGPDGYRSAIERIHIVPGLTYYIVIDGYVNQCGDYILEVDNLGPCIPECTEIWELEGEPTCEDGYDDRFNAGCNAYPHSFRSIPPSSHVIRICGTSGWFPQYDSRATDDDWYEIQVEHPGQIDIFCQAEFDCSLWLLDGRDGCGQVETIANDEGHWCESMATVSAELTEGTYWIVVEPGYGVGICGSGYRLWIDGYTPDPMAVADDPSDSGVRIHAPVPNPSTDGVDVHYTLPIRSVVRIAIYDIGGRLVRSLVDGFAQPGPGHVAWDGRDNAGREVVSGVYECRITTVSGMAARPFLRLR